MASRDVPNDVDGGYNWDGYNGFGSAYGVNMRNAANLQEHIQAGDREKAQRAAAEAAAKAAAKGGKSRRRKYKCKSKRKYNRKSYRRH